MKRFWLELHVVQCAAPAVVRYRRWLEVQSGPIRLERARWQRAVCQPTGPLAQAGGPTDGGSAG